MSEYERRLAVRLAGNAPPRDGFESVFMRKDGSQVTLEFSCTPMFEGERAAGAVLTLAEEVWRAAGAGETFDTAGLAEVVQRRAPIYDKAQEGQHG